MGVTTEELPMIAILISREKPTKARHRPAPDAVSRMQNMRRPS